MFAWGSTSQDRQKIKATLLGRFNGKLQGFKGHSKQRGLGFRVSLGTLSIFLWMLRWMEEILHLLDSDILSLQANIEFHGYFSWCKISSINRRNLASGLLFRMLSRNCHVG